MEYNDFDSDEANLTTSISVGDELSERNVIRSLLAMLHCKLLRQNLDFSWITVGLDMQLSKDEIGLSEVMKNTSWPASAKILAILVAVTPTPVVPNISEEITAILFLAFIIDAFQETANIKCYIIHSWEFV